VTTTTEPIRPPSRALFLSEGARALSEIAAYPYARAPLAAAARGDGHPVLVIPGFTASDASTQTLRNFLERQGWVPYGWELGRNLGPRPDLERQMVERLAAIRAEHGRAVSLIGQSLGGIYTRELARWAPQMVRQVITLGSPFGGTPGVSSNVQALYDEITGVPPDRLNAELLATLDQAPPVPTTAIYSKADGIVSWRSCIQLEGHRAENIEVPGSHVGMGFNALVLYAVADRLAQPEGEWRPFERHGWRRALYPEPFPCRGTEPPASTSTGAETLFEDVAQIAGDLGHVAEEAMETGMELADEAVREIAEDVVRLAGDLGPGAGAAVDEGMKRASTGVRELGLLDFLTAEALAEAVTAQSQGRHELGRALIEQTRKAAGAAVDHLRALTEARGWNQRLELQREYLSERLSARLEELRDLGELLRETTELTVEPFSSRMVSFGRLLGRDWGRKVTDRATSGPSDRDVSATSPPDA